jgi:hypothetical protein
MKHWHITLLAALVLMCATFENTISAASRATDDMLELFRMAGAVVEVTVVRTTVGRSSRAGLPLTVVTLTVQKAYKGDFAAGAEVTAESFGGSDGGRTVVASGGAQLNVGDRAVLFLTKPASATNWRVLGGSVGQIVLTQNNQGEWIARRGSGQFEYYVRDGASVTGYRRVTCGAVTAAQSDELLQTIVRTGRPVLEREEAKAAPVLPAPAAMSAHRVAPANVSEDTSLMMRLVLFVGLTTLLWVALRRRPQPATVVVSPRRK